MVVSDQKFAHQYHVFVAYGFILMMIVLVVGNLMHSGLDAFRVNSFGKNLLHQHVKANASFGGNKNSLAGGIFYGFIGLTVLQLLSRIKFKYYSIIVLILLVLLLNTASTRYIVAMVLVLTGIITFKFGLKGLIFASSFLVIISVIFISVYAKVLLAIAKVIAMIGIETADTYAQKAARGRFELITDGLAVFNTSPIFGIGLENIRTKMGHFTHVDFLEVLIATGLIGSVFYFLFFSIILFNRFGGISLETNIFKIYPRLFTFGYLQFLVLFLSRVWDRYIITHCIGRRCGLLD